VKPTLGILGKKDGDVLHDVFVWNQHQGGSPVANVGCIRMSTADKSTSNYKMPVQMLIRRLYAICRL